MDSVACFRLAALIAGFASVLITAGWRLTGTNQGERVKDTCIGASVACLSLAFMFYFISLVVKP